MNRFEDRIAWLFAKGPRNADEARELDIHIESEARKIKNNWTDKERENRAIKAGSPVRQSFEVPVITLHKESPLLHLVED